MSNELCPPERPGRTGVLSLFLLGLKPRTQNPEPRTQNPELRTPNPELIYSPQALYKFSAY